MLEPHNRTLDYDRAKVISACRDRLLCLVWVKTGKAQSEHITSAIRP
jgi:hypothetical protein